VSVEVSHARGHAFICLHESHDVRGFRGHDSGFERVIEEVANSSVELTFGSGSFMFGQEGAWPAEANLVREGLEVRKDGTWRVHRRWRYGIREEDRGW
jgi:hypothetical protein